VPASSRPYIGGSTNNSVLNLIFGYNGLGRVTGNETGSVTGGGGNPGGASMWGPTGWTRMFNSEFGGQAAWLIPAALILGLAGLVVTLRRARTDRSRAALMLWGSWLVVTAVLFSLSKGIIHPYYTVALAPATGALVGIGGHMFWQRRSSIVARCVLAAAVLVSSTWAVVLLDRSPNWNPWLRVVVVVAGIVSAVALIAGPKLGTRAATLAVAGALVAGLAGPAAYSLQTASATHAGALPTAGPAVAGARGGPGGGPRGFPGAGTQGGNGPTNRTFTGQPPAGGQAPGGAQPGGPGGGAQPGGPGGAGGLLNGSTPSAELTTLLQTDSSSYTWVLATIGANQASGYQLASDDPVMAIGGFNGTDPTPTLAAFQAYVAKGEIHYFITGGTGGSSSTASSITTWVTNNFTSVTVGSSTLYDLTSPLA
jgi:4-amino-4-deoxy-L-arabinose transferase-like glycosyltransferase